MAIPDHNAIASALREADQHCGDIPVLVTLANDDTGRVAAIPVTIGAEVWQAYGIAEVLAMITGRLASSKPYEWLFADVCGYGLVLPKEGIAYAVGRRGDSYSIMLCRDSYPPFNSETYDISHDGLMSIINAIKAATDKAATTEHRK